MDDIGDRIRGALLGLAAGDRIGGPTAMAMRLLEGVVARGSCDVDETRGRYLAWHRAEGFDQGPTSARVLDLLAGGCAPALAVARVDAEAGGLTGGCNPMHRAGPLGAAFVVPDAALAEAARADAAITHAHPLAGEAAAAAASLLRLVLRGVAWDDAASRAADGRDHAIALAMGGWREAPRDRGGFAPVVLHAAMHFAGTASGFDAALSAALAFAGPSNYAPVTAGTFAGARFGARAIAAARIAPVHDKAGLERVARALVAMASGASARGP
jgi:ADP-ribosylglycohydrolase